MPKELSRESAMDVKDAVRKAKQHIQELFDEEDISHIGLEEVEPSVDDNCWFVTIGFSRPWDYSKNALSAISGGQPGRSYKVVTIDEESGEVVSVKDRQIKMHS